MTEEEGEGGGKIRYWILDASSHRVMRITECAHLSLKYSSCDYMWSVELRPENAAHSK